MKRTYVKVTLALESAWRIGDWQPDDANTLATLRDPADPSQVWIPGSSIAGSLRRAPGGDPVALFGSQPPDDPSENLTRSPWWILGIALSGQSSVESRQRTAIDRHRRAAAKSGLFTADEVATGDDSQATIYLRGDNLNESDLQAWIKTWSPRIGGGSSIGMGRARITAMRSRTFDLANDNDLLNLLTAQGRGAERLNSLLQQANDADLGDTKGDKPWLTAHLTVTNMAITQENEKRTEGSTFKGLLRSRVEFIGRSLGYKVCRGDEGAPWTGDECDVCEVFGSVKQRGILEFGSAIWSKPTNPKGDEKPPQTVERIAIDRFTGGALDGALWPQSYYPAVSMILNVHKHRDFPKPWVQLALFHSLRDLDDQLCTIGPEGASGFGFADVGEITVAGAAQSLAELCAPIPLPAYACEDGTNA